MMILVAGGTGRLGTMVSSHLSAQGHMVRVLTRDPDRARHLTCRFEVAVGDVRDAATIGPAMEGVDLVISTVQGFAGTGGVTPDSVDHLGNVNLIDAAADRGADVILMSVVGAAPGSEMELFRAKFAAEEHLRATAPGWTIVRATAFVELWADLLTKAPVFGRGDNPINFVSVADVAACVERAASDPGLRGRVLEIGGPENLSMNDLAALLRDVTGRPHTIRHVPRWALRAMSPVSRQARAALTMDTIDLTFDPATADDAGLGSVHTDPRSALRALTTAR